MKGKYKLSRKEFLKLSLLSVTGIAIPGRDAFSFDAAAPKAMVGVCASWEDSAMAKKAGCLFIEEGVGKILMPTKTDDEFSQQYNTLHAAHSLGIRSFIYFLPGQMKAIGPEANHEAIINYASTAFKRAGTTGAKTIVFGSGKSREIPSGFEKSEAKQQMISLCSKLAPVAKEHKVILAVEQLNRGETNFLNMMDETAEIVNAVSHPNFKMVCDIYHALKEEDDPQTLVKYKEHIVHCHIAERETRTPPGTKGDDFTPYFKALKKINYKGGISLECRWGNMETEIAGAVKTIQEQYGRA